MKSAIFLVSLVALANAQLDELPSGISCANVRCREACLDNPTRCVTRCNATRTCPEDKVCLSGYCDDKPKLTCATVECRGGYVCRENPIQCIKECETKKDCSGDTVCLSGYCEEILTNPIRPNIPSYV